MRSRRRCELIHLACYIEPRLFSAFIFGSRRCGLTCRFTSLACRGRLAARRAPLASQCALLGGCQFSFRFRFHGFPFFLSGRQIRRDGQTVVSLLPSLSRANEGGGKWNYA